MPIDQLLADGDACGECPLVVDRRHFLRDAAIAAVATLAALGAAPRAALADAVRSLAPHGASGAERRYAIPSKDSVQVDASNEIILVRWRNRAISGVFGP